MILTRCSTIEMNPVQCWLRLHCKPRYIESWLLLTRGKSKERGKNKRKVWKAEVEKKRWVKKG